MNTQNNQDYCPEVVVAGMPSCGKTVFLTVLAKKFTNQIIGREKTPLGFRMETVDKDTLDVVNAAYQCLLEGNWPSVTTEGQIMPLKWCVYTGQRHVFDLTSMDLAGETFRKAFGIRGEEGTVTGKAGRHSSRIQRNSDAEVFSGVDDSDDTSVNGERRGGGAKELDEAVQRLNETVKAAKVFCFMMNINLPDRSCGETLKDPEKAAISRFKSAVETMYFVLKDNEELRAKTIIVLSQAYRHQGAIDRAGGPALYLGQVCGQCGIELCNLVQRSGIPVLAVSAINETGGKGNGLPTIVIPDDIPSSGLFGFLLVIAGSVAKEDALSKVKEAYVKFQCARAEYLQSPSLLVGERFVQAKVRQEAAQAFVKACNSYLDDQANFMSDDSAASLGKGALSNFRRFIKQAPEVQCALDDVYFKRDELWDRALRRAVVTPERRTVDNVRAFVQKGLEEAFPTKTGNATNDEFLYGFDVKELALGSDAKSFDEWVNLNIQGYAEDFKKAIEDVERLGQQLSTAVDDLQAFVRDGKFDSSYWRNYWRAKEVYGEWTKKLSCLRSDWLDDGKIPFPRLDDLQRDLKAVADRKIREAEAAHEQYEKENSGCQASPQSPPRPAPKSGSGVNAGVSGIGGEEPRKDEAEEPRKGMQDDGWPLGCFLIVFGIIIVVILLVCL